MSTLVNNLLLNNIIAHRERRLRMDGTVRKAYDTRTQYERMTSCMYMEKDCSDVFES